MTSAIPIIVRPFEASDAPSFLSAVKSSMRELCYWMPWCHSGYSLTDAESWMTHCLTSWESGSEFPLGIFDGAISGRHAGVRSQKPFVLSRPTPFGLRLLTGTGRFESVTVHRGGQQE